MELKERHISDLNDIVNTASKIRGVVGILLFGSFAKGDYDEYSDYDLLILFEDRDLMWQNWDDLFKVVGDLNLNLHVIPETLEELKTANPTFLNELLIHGKVLFSKLPLEVFLPPVNLEPFSLIVYDMSDLKYRDKMKVVYSLYRKRGVGAVAKMGGIKLSESAILVPRSSGDEAVALLNSFSVKAKKLEIYMSEESFKTWLD